jgi:DNA-binding MarR family transcriptional regulator
VFDSCEAAESPLADLSGEEFAVWAGFLQTHATLARELDADLRNAHGLPLTELEILLWLANRPHERMRMAALANTVLLSPSGLSRAVERLETRGLVRRMPCTEDRRGSYAVLTDSGITLVRSAGATHAANIKRRFLDRLTAGEQLSLASAWERVLAGSEQSCACPENPLSLAHDPMCGECGD